jgi:hypothetical protein
MERCGLVPPLPKEGNQLSEGEYVGIFPMSGGEECRNIVSYDGGTALRVELTVNDESGENLIGIEEEQASLDDGVMGFAASRTEVGYESVVVSCGCDDESGVTGADSGADGLAEGVEEGGVVFVEEESVAGVVR